MPRSLAAFVLVSLLLSAPSLCPAAAAAADFAPAWTLTGWTFVQDLGNTDGDAQRELVFSSKADGHFALVDGLTGAISKEFPEFARDDSEYTVQDVDGDGRLELFFRRMAPASLARGYDWDGSQYATLFAHTDPMETWGLVNLRGATTFDFMEISSTDVRVRDLSGAVIFRASTAIPGWTGNAPTATLVDLDQDGVLELGVVENNFTATTRTRFFEYAGGFAPAWSVTGWQVVGAVSTDPDPPAEIVAVFLAGDGRFGFLDGNSGALEADFPGFSFYNASNFNLLDADGDGTSEWLFFQRLDVLTTRLFTAYRWNAGGYTPMFSHTDVIDDYSYGHFRDATGWELFETIGYPNPGPGEVRIRDLTGTVRFRASTDIPGWTGAVMLAMTTDTDQDGVLEFALQDGNTTRLLRYSAGAFTPSWSTSAWKLRVELSNTDGDPETELLVVSAADHHFALLDTPTGALEQEFPAFNEDDAFAQPVDVDADGRLEMFFSRFSFATPLTTGYDWTPSGYATLFSHTDVVEGMGEGHFRTPGGSVQFAEFATNDLRLRDMTGVVIFRASTDLPGWTGVNRDAAVLDVNGDGVHELLATDDVAVRLVRHDGVTSVTNPGEGRDLQLLGNAPNPFRAGTAFRFSTRAAGDVGIRVFDAGGRLVRRLDRHLAAGPHEVAWDGRDERGNAVPSGMLFYEISANGTRQSARMVRLGR